MNIKSGEDYFFKKFDIKLLMLIDRPKTLTTIKIGYIKNKSTRILYSFTAQNHSHIANNAHAMAGIKSGQLRADDGLRLNKRITK